MTCPVAAARLNRATATIMALVARGELDGELIETSGDNQLVITKESVLRYEAGLVAVGASNAETAAA